MSRKSVRFNSCTRFHFETVEDRIKRLKKLAHTVNWDRLPSLYDEIDKLKNMNSKELLPLF